MFNENKFVYKCIPFSLDNVVFIWDIHTSSAGSNVRPGWFCVSIWAEVTAVHLSRALLAFSVFPCLQGGHLKREHGGSFSLL